jgi:hypothetical protein
MILLIVAIVITLAAFCLLRKAAPFIILLLFCLYVWYQGRVALDYDGDSSHANASHLPVQDNHPVYAYQPN